MQRKRTRRAWSSMRQSGVSTCGRQQESNKTHQSYGRMQAATDQKEGKRNSGGNLDAIGTVASYSLGATSLCSCCNRNWQEFLCRKNSKMIIFFSRSGQNDKYTEIWRDSSCSNLPGRAGFVWLSRSQILNAFCPILKHLKRIVTVE
jgi:hypothetical protein